LAFVLQRDSEKSRKGVKMHEMCFVMLNLHIFLLLP